MANAGRILAGIATLGASEAIAQPLSKARDKADQSISNIQNRKIQDLNLGQGAGTERIAGAGQAISGIPQAKVTTTGYAKPQEAASYIQGLQKQLGLKGPQSTLGAIKPTRPTATTPDPAYIIFDADVAEGSTTARIRACTNPSYSGGQLATVDYVGDIVAGVTYAYIIWDDEPVWSPSCFSTFRNRLCAADGNTVYFSGFIGSASPFVEPDQNNWAFWYELNSVTVGHSGQGNIVRMEPLGDQLIVFLENATYRIYGIAPINGAYENQLVVEEVNPTLGINSYDSVGVAPDGNALFVAGNDGQAYVFQSEYVLISEPVRLHPQFQNIDIVHVSEQYAIFTGTSVDPSRVPFEITPTDGGFTYQTTPAFCFNAEKQMWTMSMFWNSGGR